MKTEKRKFVCTFQGCNKSFNRRDYLDRHAANHLPVKPFSCKWCERHFARADLYENHLNTKYHKKRSAFGNSDQILNVRSSGKRTKTKKSDCTTDYRTISQDPPYMSYTDTVEYDSRTLSNTSMSGDSSYGPYSSYTDIKSERVSPPSYENYYHDEVLPNNKLNNGNGISNGSGRNGFMFENIRRDHHIRNIPIKPDYDWLFEDNTMDDSRSSISYDRLYISTVRHYEERAKSLDILDQRTNVMAAAAAQSTSQPIRISESRAHQLIHLLYPSAGYDHNMTVPLDAQSIGYYLEETWSSVQPIHFFIHRPTFDTEKDNIHLLAIMVIIGMSLSSDRNIQEFASSAYGNVVRSLEKVIFNKDLPKFEEDVGLLQAFCLLMRYEERFLKIIDDFNNNMTETDTDGGINVPKIAHDGNGSRHSYATVQSKWLLERYMWLLIPRATQQESQSATQPFCYARAVKDGYEFADNTDEYQAWIEWTKYEACKRAMHFAVYCDCVHMLQDDNIPMQLSIFDVDTHMPCPDVLWTIDNTIDFFNLVGPERKIRTVPYLYVIKSMLKLPGFMDELEDEGANTKLPIFVLVLLLYGLLSVARAMTGSDTTIESLVNKLNNAGKKGHWNVEFHETDIQARLSKAFDIWNQYYDMCSGLLDNQHAFGYSGNGEEHIETNNMPCNYNRGFESSKNRIENASLMGQLQVRPNSDLFADYIVLILLHNHAAQILMHHDLQMIVSTANGIPYWLNGSKRIMDNVDLDLCYRWAGTSETRRVTSVACLFLTRAISGKTLLVRDRAENLLLGLTTYYAVLIIWLFSTSLPLYGSLTGLDAFSITQDAYHKSVYGHINEKLVIQDASRYLHFVWKLTNLNAPEVLDETAMAPHLLFPGEVPDGHQAITCRSIIILGSWLLANVNVGQFKTGGETLYHLYQRLYLGIGPDQLMNLK